MYYMMWKWCHVYPVSNHMYYDVHLCNVTVSFHMISVFIVALWSVFGCNYLQPCVLLCCHCHPCAISYISHVHKNPHFVSHHHIICFFLFVLIVLGHARWDYVLFSFFYFVVHVSHLLCVYFGVYPHFFIACNFMGGFLVWYMLGWLICSNFCVYFLTLSMRHMI